MADVPKKKAAKAKPKAPAVLESSSPNTHEEDPMPNPTVWFGRKQKINGRSQVQVNEATEETDVLSLAIHSGFSGDEDLSIFMLHDETLKSLAAAAKSALSHSSKLTGNPDGSIVTRYYSEGFIVPEEPDTRICYRAAPEGKPARWAVRAFLITTICALLDDSIRVRMAGSGTTSPTAEESRFVGSMVTFRGQRRELLSIPLSEIETAERDVMTSHAISLMRELVCIRRMLQGNCEKVLTNLSSKLREAEGRAQAEQMLRVTQVAAMTAERDREIAARAHETNTYRAERSSSAEHLRMRMIFCMEESSARMTVLTHYHDGVVSLLLRLTHQEGMRQPRITEPKTSGTAGEEVVQLRQDLEDARLEIARLKDDARGKAVPKPKTSRRSKDPDLHPATEADIRNSVRSHLGIRGSQSSLGTPTQSIVSRKSIGVPRSVLIQEEMEIEAARKLKSLSRSREQDLCEAELASRQLCEIIDALSSLLTKVELTIEDVAARRTTILNHMRSLSMHSRSIASIIRERPYLLALARRMNHERRPIVQLSPLRALINVAASNVKALQRVESITLESVGGAFDVMSLEEAAASSAQEEVEIIVPQPVEEPELKIDAVKVLTRATLRRHTLEAGQSESSSDSD